MRIKIAGLFGLTAALAGAQTAAMIQSIRSDGDVAVVTLRASGFPFGRPITGAPYSADRISEHKQTLADGTHIDQSRQLEHIYRDSQGRTRRERPVMFGNGSELPPLVEIVDPVAGFAYVLDDGNRVAHRVALPAPRANTSSGVPAPGAAAQGRPPADPNRPQRSREKLDPQTMEGLMVEGTRFTTTYPAGSQGNDRPITDTSEIWTSPELHVTVLSKASSARNGENTTRLTNISRAEPDPSLFQPPADYTVVDEKGSFEMRLKRN